MSTRQKHILLPVALATGSFFGAVALAATTNPTDNLSFTLLFFILTLVFLTALGYLLTYLRWGKVTLKSRYRIFIVSFLILVGLMLRSSGSLNRVEAMVLILIGIGLWFYSARRT